MLVPALSRCCLGVRILVGREAKGLFGDRLVESGILVVCVLVVAPRDRSCTRRDRSGGGAIALTRWGEVLLRSNARSGPVPLLLGCPGDGGVCLGTGCLGIGNRGCVLLGVAPRDRSCTRRDRSGGGAIALTRWGEWLLRSNARSGSVALLLGCSGDGGVCLGTGCLRVGNRGGVRLGVAPRDRSCTRRDRSGGGAFALTRWGEVLLRSYARSGPVPLLHHFSGA